jgi:hypothetical protein
MQEIVIKINLPPSVWPSEALPELNRRPKSHAIVETKQPLNS